MLLKQVQFQETETREARAAIATHSSGGTADVSVQGSALLTELTTTSSEHYPTVWHLQPSRWPKLSGKKSAQKMRKGEKWEGQGDRSCVVLCWSQADRYNCAGRIDKGACLCSVANEHEGCERLPYWSAYCVMGLHSSRQEL
jgi:hypothetical protein